MKKNPICLAVVMLIITSTCIAQSEVHCFLRPSLTSVRGNEVVKELFNPALNYSGGVTLGYHLSKTILLNVGLQYERKGGKHEGTIELRDPMNNPILEGEIKIRQNWHYLVVPVELRRRFGSTVYFDLGGGAYAGYLIKQQSISSGAVEEKVVNTNAYKRIDLGLTLSAHVYRKLNDKIALSLGLNDQLGLLDVSDGAIVHNGSIKHNSIGLVLGFVIMK
jgi:hypothetical protein